MKPSIATSEPDVGLGLILTVAAATLVFIASMMATDKVNIADISCPVEQKIIRYPEFLGGPHPAVCNPTGIVWTPRNG